MNNKNVFEIIKDVQSAEINLDPKYRFPFLVFPSTYYSF